MQLHDNQMPASDERLESLWTEMVNDKNYHILVAEEDGKIVVNIVAK